MVKKLNEFVRNRVINLKYQDNMKDKDIVKIIKKEADIFITRKSIYKYLLTHSL